ncbi:uncharacterized protein SPPG_06998 [Spizellomyces punctatus DAOM BR117]|uniref:RRM domain-containing protein n=1 Tax=Spizellomyces punctatus (strain DAOM BR117) TaxID=645134 RepID=A0A0L0H8I7_SPIPD|nr:uncharacterized protein SPPG_06998 [Spizellomyces punctatus DAOM BR117]KNC97522.1 hypothetical protein SPPG_06998 [Spizellomyces punctatus DAOM BR117]|eukprot:XP_016605562.1 hypothetical protein SPPG_06998 [Spizellomyces punctatus DAOM BR117]
MSNATGRQLFVGNLPFIIGWQDLKDLFREAGTVIRADVATGPAGRSRGFGTVLFATAEEAQAAINLFNNYDWNGRKIEVREDRAVASTSGVATPPIAIGAAPVINGNGNVNVRALYVGNIPYSAGWQDLKDLFRQTGNVVRADVPQDFQGRSKGFGTVVMSTVDEARKAVSLFNSYEWNGRRIEVREDRTFVEGAAPRVNNNANFATPAFNGGFSPVLSGGNTAGRQLFVGNLPFTVQWQELKDLFREAGNVQRADVAMDNQGRSRGYGQVLMATVEEAQMAIKVLNGREVQGRTIEVREDKFAADASSNIPGTQVFVGNLPYSSRWQDLKDLFRPHGLNPVHADIMAEPGTGRSKGCGIVRFNTPEEAERAVQEVNGTNVGGRNVIVRLDKFA